MNIKTLLIYLSFGLTSLSAVHSGEPVNPLKGGVRYPALGIKSNLLYDATGTFNLGPEILLSDYLSLDVSVSYNPWTFSGNKKFKQLTVSPELRYWIHEPFNGYFFGAGLMYSRFNAGGLHLPLGLSSSLKESRYSGHAYGISLHVGYQWILSRKFNLETSLGAGYLYMDYTRYECVKCGEKLGTGSKNYLGPTQAGLSLIYLIN